MQTPMCHASSLLLGVALAMACVREVRSRRSLRNATAHAACGAAAYAEFRRSLADAEGPNSHRQALFEQRCKAVLLQNSRVGALWKASLNRFADRTDAELRALLGHRRAMSSRHRRSAPSVSLHLQPGAAARSTASSSVGSMLSEKVDWRSSLRSSGFIRDQGSCGSCWAVATAGAVEMHAELRRARSESSPMQLSSSHLVRCVENPQHCGGSGGCDGATAELAFEFIMKHGIAVEPRTGNLMSVPSCRHEGRRATVSNFVVLPVNREEPLLAAIATAGPVVVTVDAEKWYSYKSGIFDSCRPDAIVNHAVLAVGYDQRSLIIRNSWGREWGEGGYIRLLRVGDGWCGTDRHPEEGSGCLGGPKEVTVCGMCGVLMDSSYPIGARFIDPADDASKSIAESKHGGPSLVPAFDA
uniref:Peptidase C1A papain C-terminal domain-containing protein n=1 Tax=Alexandrium monilatum TaxID=311494 RepID=A0A7S4R2E2_9DINO